MSNYKVSYACQRCAALEAEIALLKAKATEQWRPWPPPCDLEGNVLGITQGRLVYVVWTVADYAGVKRWPLRKYGYGYVAWMPIPPYTPPTDRAVETQGEADGE